ncbi:hypothetical protein Z043_119048, partial [Scleropages formosus]
SQPDRSPVSWTSMTFVPGTQMPGTLVVGRIVIRLTRMCGPGFRWAVSTDPVVQEEDQPVAPLREGLLRRIARMTPLWRIMGSKPHGAYCQDNYECSTGICR